MDVTVTHTPDCWVMIKVKGDNPHYRVIGGWSGGYLTGDSWKLNSGVTRMETDDDSYCFYGHSGSVYRCGKKSYGLRMCNAHIWESLKRIHGDAVELLDDCTDWETIAWT